MNSLLFIFFNIFAFSISNTSGAGKRLPENLKRCVQDESISKCLQYSVTDALAKMAKGIPDLGVPQLEPLTVSGINIQTGSGPVSIKQTYTNLKMYGLTNSNLTSYNARLKDYRLITDSFSPHLAFIADYVMDGRILLLPIRGKGICNITMDDLVVKHDLIGEPLNKKGDLYMKLKEYKVTFHPKKVTFHFSNLFNGNKVLGDQMNRFLNENSEVVFNELKPSYEHSFGLIFKDITNKIFTKVPFNQIFLESKDSSD